MIIVKEFGPAAAIAGFYRPAGLAPGKRRGARDRPWRRPPNLARRRRQHGCRSCSFEGAVARSRASSSGEMATPRGETAALWRRSGSSRSPSAAGAATWSWSATSGYADGSARTPHVAGGVMWAMRATGGIAPGCWRRPPTWRPSPPCTRAPSTSARAGGPPRLGAAGARSSEIAREIRRAAPRAARASPASSAPGARSASGANGASASRRRRPGVQASGEWVRE